MSRELKFRAWDGEKITQMRTLFLDIKYRKEIIIMQYTGLNDKNGKEIYEGDIQDYGNGRIVVVEFYDGCFGLRMPSGDFERTWVRPKQFEVIGNIYSNPELLSK